MKKIMIILILLIPTIVFADTGPKPSITITLKNIEGTDYVIDLMSDFSNKESLINEIVDRYENYKEREIYKYHEDNWYATSLRNFLLWGDIEGTENHVHRFTYFGVPSVFKIIIELPDGTIKVSDKIEKTTFDFDVTIDVADMKIVSQSIPKIDKQYNFGILALTIIIEIGIAFLFKTKKYYIVALVNLITNLGLQVLMVNVSAISTSILCFIALEFAIVLIEGIIYFNTLKIEKKKIILYTIVANLTTALLTFII